MPEVKIVSEIPSVSYPHPGEPKLVVAVTYQMGDRPPRTIWVDKATYSDKTVAEAIRKDLEAAKLAGPRTLTI